MILTSIFLDRAGAELDRWADFPHLFVVGDKVPARGPKPSTGKRPSWRITDKITDYRKGEVTYTVEPLP